MQATTLAATPPAPALEMPEWKRLGTPQAQAVCRIQAGILRHLRDILDEAGHTEVLAPVIGPVTDPGTRGAKQATVDHYGHRYKVMSSAILYKQLMLHGLDRLYMVAPCIRMEPAETATTGRHLTEFYQVDVEMRDGSLDDAVDLAARLISETARRIRITHAADLDLLGAPDRSEASGTTSLRRMTHAEAVAELAGAGYDMDPHTEIPWEGERILSGRCDGPIAITHYPRGSRGFYDKLDGDLLLDFDILYPAGFGEAVSGAVREHTLEAVVARIRESGEDVRKYGWYIDMLRDGTPASSGFGIGVERLTRYLCGLDTVQEARPFPKTPGKVSP